MDIPSIKITSPKAPHYGATLRFFGSYHFDDDTLASVKHDLKTVKYPLSAMWLHKLFGYIILALMAGLIFLASRFLLPLRLPLNYVLFLVFVGVISIYHKPVSAALLRRVGLSSEVFLRGAQAHKFTAKISAKALEFYDLTGRDNLRWDNVYRVCKSFSSVLFLTRCHGRFMVFIIPLSAFENAAAADKLVKFSELQISASKSHRK